MQHPCDGLLHLRVRDFAGRTFDQLVPPCQLFLPQRFELVQKSTRKQRKVGAVKRCCNPLEHFGQLTPGSSESLEGESFTGILEQVLSELWLWQLVHDQAQLPDD